MTQLEKFKRTIATLKTGGWGPLFDHLGIDLDSEYLKSDLLRVVEDVDSIRLLPGFEELCSNANKLIEPGKPAESILFHALASPAVNTDPNGKRFTVFPSPTDLDVAENIVFGLQPPSVPDLKARFAGLQLAVGVFARDYRQKSGTVHGNHADMIFSRTGISRVGTLDAHWDGESRSYQPLLASDDKHAFRVMPCRYGVYVAVKLKGNQSNFGPFKADRTFEASKKFGNRPPQSTRHDVDHDFWVPVHKLFSGADCLKSSVIGSSLIEEHFNEKLRRIHLENMGRPRSFQSGFNVPEINSAPFVKHEGIAEFLDHEVHGSGTLSAIAKPRLVEPAVNLEGEPLTVNVPNSGQVLSSSYYIVARRGRRAPEYVHVRTQLKNNGSERNLNEIKDIAGTVRRGRVGNSSPYKARHYNDFTGDGWLIAQVTGLQGEISRRLPAYSIISAPNFYPYVSQSELLDWSLDEVSDDVRDNLWAVEPLALCDQRDPANLSLSRLGGPFAADDRTISAMVGLIDSAHQYGSTHSSERIRRASFLPDTAAGVFAPGWDISRDFDIEKNEWHLAAHGLGSPFPEDAKLCAAISAYWPAVSPDTSRSSQSMTNRNPRIIAPMTDREVGMEDAPPWDGVLGSRVVNVSGVDHIEEDDYDHIDYVQSALDGLFTMSETMKVDQPTYQSRILATNRMFDVLESGVGSADLRMLSFSPAHSEDPDLIEEVNSIATLTEPVHTFTMVDTDVTRSLVQDPNEATRWLRRDRITAEIKVFVGENGVVVWRLKGEDWQVAFPPL